ncbi:MAG TPA: SDR family oxidoreductase [Chloroflexota bacterium]|nr:SDR family oxidoreductase [Chloroflexota bacterium]
MHEQVVAVTGASSGVGRAIAQATGQRGAKVALLARNEEGLQAAAREIEQRGGAALICSVDVADAAAVERAATAIEQRWGRIDTWVNCAMLTVFARVMDTSPEEFRRVTETSYLGYVHGTQAALRHMLPHDEGLIIQIGSALAYRSIPLQSAYCGAKAAIRGFTDALRCELIHDGSHVQLSHLQAPAVNTPQATRQRNKMERQQQPIPPMFTPESIADVVLWVATQDHAPREMLIGLPTMKAVWGQLALRLLGAAGLLDRYLATAAWDTQFVDVPDQQQGRDILWHTLPGDPGAHGPYRDRERGPDVQMRLRTLPRLTAVRDLAAAVVLAARTTANVSAWWASATKPPGCLRRASTM